MLTLFDLMWFGEDSRRWLVAPPLKLRKRWRILSILGSKQSKSEIRRSQ